MRLAVVPAVLVLALLSTGVDADPPAYSVTPVFFIPDPSSFPVGYQPSEAILQEDLANIDWAMEYVRQWYGDALGLATSLNVQPVVRMDGWHGINHYGIYWDQPVDRYSDGIRIVGTWGKVLGEVGSRGYGAGTAASPKLVVIFCKGAGGFAGGAQYHDDPGGGKCMLGDWCLDALAGDRIPPEDHVWWWSDTTDQLGAISHEMGHCWGLAHTDTTTNPVTGVSDNDYTVMYSFWNYPDYPTNPADPSWPLHGLHGWADDLGPGSVRYPGYQDQFMLTYRSDWLVTPRWPAGDLDFDGDVDLYDFAMLADCLGGPGVLQPPIGCDADVFADSDLAGEDGDVDAADFAVFQELLPGS